MKLLYVWLGEFANIKNAGFNLSSDHEISFDFKSNKLSFKEIENTLPGFFGSNILDVKLIVGQNGVGKSKLLEYLTYWIGNYNVPAILVYDRIILVSQTYFNNFNKGDYSGQVIAINRASNYRENESYKNSPQIIYYNGHVDNRRVRYSSYAKDLSSNTLIVEDIRNIKFNKRNYNQTSAHKIQDLLKQINFAESLPHVIPFQFPKIIGAYFINKINQGEEARFWRETLASTQYGRITIDIQRRTNRIFEQEGVASHKDTLKFFKLHFKSVILEKYILFKSFNQKKEKDQEGKINFLNLLDNVLDINANPEEDGIDFLVHDKFLKEFRKIDNESIEIKAVEKYFKWIDKLNQKEITPKFSYSDPYDRPQEYASQCIEFGIINSKFAGLVQHYMDTEFYEDYLDYAPRDISSGESSFMKLFSRIYHIKVEISSKKNLLILLDEPDVGFHPQWQKELFNHLIKMLPKIFPEQKIQLIIATHSPFILSDLPKNNALYLRKSDHPNVTNPIVLNYDDTQHMKAFGANIYDILGDSFFLQDGFIGSFADKKILEVVKWLNTKSLKQSKYYKAIIDMIDEPLIKHKLLERFQNKMKSSKND